MVKWLNLTTWMSVRLRTKWLWVRIPLQWQGEVVTSELTRLVGSV